MTYIDPQQQLLQSRGLLTPQGPTEPQGSSYVSAVERRATELAAGGVNFGTAALVGAPLVASLGGGLLSMVTGGKGMLGRATRGMDIGFSMMDPFGAAFEVGPKVLAGKMSLAGAGLSLGAAYGFSKVLGGTSDFIRESMLQGQRDFLATRSLTRELPGMGFGPQSVLSPMAGPSAWGQNQVSSLTSNIRQITSDFGITSGQGRNILSGMAQEGMLNTSSVSQISSSFRSKLQELKSLAAQVGGDIQEAHRIYQSLGQMGFRSPQSRSHILGQMTATSALTGMSVPQVGQHMAGVMQMAQGAGLGGFVGADLGVRSLQTVAYMQAAGLADPTYLERSGGTAGMATRMSALHLQAATSPQASVMMSNIYGPTGGRTLAGLQRVLSGQKTSANYSALAGMDPYSVPGMQEDFSSLTGAAVLARVSRINQDAKNPLEARRNQFSFLSQMGVANPQDQMQYLSFLRAQPGADFAGAVQGLRNDAVQSRDFSLQSQGGLASKGRVLSETIDEISRRLSRTFERAGEALLRDIERTSVRVSAAMEGRSRDYGSGVSGQDSMRAVSRQIMHGQLTPAGLDNRRLERMLSNSAVLRQSLSTSVNLTGIDQNMRASMLRGGMARTMYGLGRGSSMLSDALSTGTDSLLEDLLGLEKRARFSPVGALGENLPHGLATGDIFMGSATNGGSVFASPADYFQSVGMDHGVELERGYGASGNPLGMRIARTDHAALSLLQKRKGAGFSRTWREGLGGQVSKSLDKNDYLMSALGAGGVGMAGGFFLGAGVGGLLGAGVGGVGSIPGALVGGALGAGLGGLGGVMSFTGSRGLKEIAGMGGYGGVGVGALLGTAMAPGIGTLAGAGVGYLLNKPFMQAMDFWGLSPNSEESGGIKGVLDRHSEEMGVARDVELSGTQRRALRRSYGLLGQAGKLDPLAAQLFGEGKTFENITIPQKRLLREMVAKQGNVGEAMAGIDENKRLSTSQFNAILSEDMGRSFAGSLFGVGFSQRAQEQEALRYKGGLDIGAWGHAIHTSSNTGGEADLLLSDAKLGIHNPLIDATQRVVQNQSLGMYTQRKAASLSNPFFDFKSAYNGSGADAIRSLTTLHGGKRMMTATSLERGMGELASQGVDPEEISRIRGALQAQLRDASEGKGDMGAYYTKIDRGEAPGHSSIEGLQNALSPALLDEMGARINPDALGEVSGLSAGLSNLVGLSRGGLTDDTLRAAIAQTSGQDFFTSRQKVSAVGGLVELLRSRTSSTLGDDEMLDELVSQGVLDEGTAGDVRRMRGSAFGNLDNTKLTDTLLQLESVAADPKSADRFRELARSVGDTFQYSAQSNFVAARNKQVQNIVSRQLAEQSGSFDQLLMSVDDLGGVDTSALRRTLESKGEAQSLSFLRQQGGSGMLGDLASGLRDKAKQKGLPSNQVGMYQSLASEFEKYSRLTDSGSDDFFSLAASATQGGISSKGGKLSLDRAKLFSGASALYGEGAGAVLASDPVMAIEKLLKGGGSDEDRKKLLYQMAQAQGSPEEKARQVLGNVGKLRAGMSDTDAMRQFDTLVKDTRNPQGNEDLKAAFEQSLEKVFASFIGQDDNKRAKKEQMIDAVIKIGELLGNASILKGDPPEVKAIFSWGEDVTEGAPTR